jgi:hypothetical protein
VGEASILAGAPAKLRDPAGYRNRKYDPLADLGSANAVDRYAAVKAISRRDDVRRAGLAALEKLLPNEREERVALEAAGAAAYLGSAMGQEKVEGVLWGDGRPDLRMEAVLILTELASPFARSELLRVATDARFVGDEIRQAAVWGLGKAGLKAYGDLVRFIDDADENVAMHAIIGFGEDTPQEVIAMLVRDLVGENARRAAAASEALRAIGSEAVVSTLSKAAAGGTDWVIATLGRMPPPLVRKSLGGSELLARVAPLLLLNENANWLSSESRLMDLAFLSKQYLPV